MCKLTCNLLSVAASKKIDDIQNMLFTHIRFNRRKNYRIVVRTMAGLRRKYNVTVTLTLKGYIGGDCRQTSVFSVSLSIFVTNFCLLMSLNSRK